MINQIPCPLGTTQPKFMQVKCQPCKMAHACNGTTESLCNITDHCLDGLSKNLQRMYHKTLRDNAYQFIISQI